MDWHQRTEGQSEIRNKPFKQYVRHFTEYYQDDWETLLPTANFLENNNKYVSFEVFPFG